MTPCLEFEEKNVEKAVKKACDELKIPKEKLKYEIISYGSTGIFGLVGIKKAKIRVVLSKSIPKSESALEVPSKKLNDERHDNILQKQAVKDECSSIQIDSDVKEICTLPDDSDVKEICTLPDDSDVKEICTLPDDSDDPVDIGRNILQRIIDFITTDATISVEQNSYRILFNVDGGNSATLIGRRGQVLEAIQYLVEKIVNKHTEQRIRVQIDVEGYLNNRRVRLQKLAGRLAGKAKYTGKPAIIRQMNAHDRRIVHLALRNDTDVRTQSVGNGFLKKLVIFPRKNSSQKEKQNEAAKLKLIPVNE